jgi:hypothetical protein
MKKFKKHLKSLKKEALKDKKTSLFYILAGLLVVLPVLSMLFLLVHNSVNVAFWDQWPFVDLMAKLQHGTLSIRDLWLQHNEHRILVPQATELVVGKITGFNFRIPVVMNVITAGGSLTILILMLRRSFLNRKIVAILAIVFAWLLFSPLAAINWIWGFQLAFFMCVFFTLASIWLLTKETVLKDNRLFILAILLAAITTYCNGNGMLIWPIGFGILLWSRASRNQLIYWAAAAVILIGSYLYHFNRPGGELSASTVLKEPLAVLKYTFTYLGRTLATTPQGAKYTGMALVMILLVSCYFIYRKRMIKNIIGWLGLAAYVILTALLAAMSRLNFGVNHAFVAISYTTISVLFVLVVLAVGSYALSLWVKDFNKKQLPAYLAVFFVSGAAFALPVQAYIFNYNLGVTNVRGLNQHFKKVQHCVYTATSEADDCLLLASPDKKEVWRQIQYLRSSHWADF